MDRELAPIREKAAELRANPSSLDDALREGGERARRVASVTIKETRELMGMA
jgi:tryptophanyl-tRNA synthetase